jgi:transposase, IS5 family
MSGFTLPDLRQRYQKLSQKKDFLIRLNRVMDWERFRPLLEQIHQKPRKSNAGRKPFDSILMFKLLILQRLYNLSDEELEYQVNDRLSFMEFLGLGFGERVPDATTVWLFREHLTQAGLVEALFKQFETHLAVSGYQAQGGQILDATFVPVPKQHFSKEEKSAIEQGSIPQNWQEHPHQGAQRDLDARWTKKNNISYFGYKDHINIDAEFGFVRRYQVTDAAVHDSQALTQILDETNTGSGVWADSAYYSVLMEWLLTFLSWDSHIHERAYRNRPLTEAQQQNNREKSKTRAKVEHVFGAWVNDMGGKMIRSIGLVRAKANIGLRNLAYNLKRYVYLETKVGHEM